MPERTHAEKPVNGEKPWMTLREALKGVRSYRNSYRSFCPSKAKILKRYEGDRPLFNKFNLEEQIESIYQRKVRLPSGGEIVIETCTQRLDCAGLDSKHLARESNQLVVVQVFGHSYLAVSGCRLGLPAILNLLRLNAAQSGARTGYRFCDVT